MTVFVYCVTLKVCIYNVHVYESNTEVCMGYYNNMNCYNSVTAILKEIKTIVMMTADRLDNTGMNNPYTHTHTHTHTHTCVCVYLFLLCHCFEFLILIVIFV